MGDDIISRIKSVRIYPPIAVTRVGNSEETAEDVGYFFAPEIPGVFDTPKGGFKYNGQVKRQAVRFRVYAYDDKDQVIYDLTEDPQDIVEGIVWNLGLANKKPAWYMFQGKNQPLLGLRNPTVQANLDPAKRDRLVIAASHTLLWRKGDTNPPAKNTQFVGKFYGSKDTPADVYLGEAWVDAKGKLCVLGGRGLSTSLDAVDGQVPLLMTDFDNANWYDDTSDGPVWADVRFKNKASLKTNQNAWVMCGPPKFSSDITAPTTLYDVMEDVYEQAVRDAQGANYDVGVVDYYKHINPVLERISKISWLNSIANAVHGPNGVAHFTNADWQQKLSQPSTDRLNEFEIAGATQYRKLVFNRLRFPDKPKYDIARNGQAFTCFMPALSGDLGRTTDGDQTTWSSITELQYERFRKWANGAFIADKPPVYQKFSDIPLAEQPDALVQSALEWTIGSPLYPGIEMSFPAEDPATYDIANGHGFHFAPTFTAGDVTKHLSLPWQSDFYMCRNHWWPSARPDDIVSDGEYYNEQRAVADATIAKTDAANKLAKLLTNRVKWERGLYPNHTDFDSSQPFYANTDMVTNWSKLGFIYKPKEFADQRDVNLYVEHERGTITRTQGILTAGSLATHLQAAMAVELTTIPIYLSAMYTVDTSTPEGQTLMFTFLSIISEEMLHLALAGNILKAIGGSPKVYDPSVIPTYPGNLPLRQPPLNLVLGPATKEQLEVFMEIEKPADDWKSGQTGKYQTIGQFYKGISEGIEKLDKIDPHLWDDPHTNCQFSPDMGYSPKDPGGGTFVIVHDKASALQAIDIIVSEGEGFKDGKYTNANRNELSHYDKFTQMRDAIAVSKTYKPIDAVVNPHTATYASNPLLQQISVTFDASYCFLLKMIELLWTIEGSAEDGTDTNRRNFIYGNMYGVMKGVLAPLAKLMLTIPFQGKFAAAAFDYYDFNVDAATPPLQQLKNLIKACVDKWNGVGTSDAVGYTAIVGTLQTVENSIGRLLEIDTPAVQAISESSTKKGKVARFSAAFHSNVAADARRLLDTQGESALPPGVVTTKPKRAPAHAAAYVVHQK